MPSAYTTSLRIELIPAGDRLNTWGEPGLNNGLRFFEKAIAGWLEVAVAADVTLSTANASEDQARYAMLKLTGVGGFNVTIPSVSKKYLIWNACTNSNTITTGAGGTVILASGDKTNVFCDGSAVYEPGYSGLGLKAYIQTIAVGGSGSVPSLSGNSGKFLTNNGTLANWANITISDISNYASDQATKTTAATNLAAAFAVAL